MAYTIERETTAMREFNSLLEAMDQYPKYVVTMDDFWKDSMEAVGHFHIADFLLDGGYLKIMGRA